MILKVGSEAIEFDGDVPMERQVKLFDDVSAVHGDFSYSFEIPKTKHNIGIFSIYTTDNESKPWKAKIPASLFSDDGQEVYTGFLRLSRGNDYNYTASFFSGNSNWIDLLDLPLRNSFTWSQYDTDYTSRTVVDSWESGYRGAITFPLLDRGGLSTRKSQSFYLEDFQPFVYVKDIVQTVTNQSGVKIIGDILKSPRYTAMITSNNGRSGIIQRIEDRSIKVGKTSPAAFGTSYAKITFDNTAGIFYNSTNLNWDTTQNRYIADADLREWKVNIAFNMSRKNFYGLQIRVNGTSVKTIQFNNLSQLNYTQTFTSELSAGDYVEVWGIILAGAIFGTGSILTSSSLTIEPIKFKKVYADQLLPDMTASEFLSNIFSVLNCIVTYNPKSKEIRADFFENIIKKPAIDVSEYVTIVEDDYEDFISDYSKRNFLVWQDQSNDDTEEYNSTNVIPFGGGLIEIDNDFLEDEGDLVELDFVAPFQKTYDFIAGSFPNLMYVEIIETDLTDNFATVSDNGDGKARFNNITLLDSYDDMLVRVSDSTVEEYNGDYRIESIDTGSNYIILQDLVYQGTATGTITVLDWEEQNNEDQVLLLSSAVNTPLIDFTGTDSAWFEHRVFILIGQYLSYSVAGYLFPNKNLRGSLVFQDNIESDWGLTSRMLNSGVKSVAVSNLPAKIYQSIDFLSPLRIKTDKVNSLFYPNRITGYEEEKIECEIELIKLI